MNLQEKTEYDIQLGRSFNGSKGLVSLRYNFKPDSVDCKKEGQLYGGPDEYTLELPGTSGDTHIFKGAKQPCKPVDALLLYDSNTKSFTLERLDSVCRLSQSRNRKLPNKPAAKGSAGMVASEGNNAEDNSDVDDIANMLEEELEKPNSTQTSNAERKAPISMSRYAGSKRRAEDDVTSSEEE